MYAIDIIRSVDEKRPNSINADSKASWLTRCDRQIFNDLIVTHEGAHCMRPFCGETEMEAEYGEMMIGEPYQAIYEYYLMAQIDLVNGDSEHYNNHMLLYNDALHNFARLWHRDHRPNRGPRFRI